MNDLGFHGFGIQDTGKTKAHPASSLPLMDWAAVYRNKDNRNMQLTKGLESVTMWCRLGYSTLGHGVIADTDENDRYMQVERMMQAGNGAWVCTRSTRKAAVFQTRLHLRPSILNWAAKRKLAHVFQAV